ncbi:MAG TPA: trypsin-like serine protease, partial [Beijerinckiaceae bacterium]|nr:trypsin-like serine protease [Beijerinckiaceae bacterium]
ALESGVVMVLDRTNAGAGFCSGVVVARNAVLTAAHCLAEPKNMRIHYRDETGAPILIDVAATAVHPLFRADAPKTRERSIDLALIRTATPLPDRFHPVTLDSGTNLIVGARIRVAGFGVTREGAGDTAGKLRLGSLEVRAPISSILLWADDPGHAGTGACMGDSGGPVFAETSDVVIAVTDWAAGAGRRRCGELTQAALVAPQRAWIEKILAQWGADSPT